MIAEMMVDCVGKHAGVEEPVAGLCGIEYCVRYGPFPSGISLNGSHVVSSYRLGSDLVPEGVFMLSEEVFHVDKRSGAEVVDSFVPVDYMIAKQISGRRAGKYLPGIRLGDDGIPRCDFAMLNAAVLDSLKYVLSRGYKYVYSVSFLGIKKISGDEVSIVVYCSR